MNRRPEEALPVLEASLVLRRRYWPLNEKCMLITQTNIASCLADQGRNDEALGLRRELYARRAALLGASHERTILSGVCVTYSLIELGLLAEAKESSTKLLLAAQSLGSDHDLTLRINLNLASALTKSPGRTRDDLRLNQRGAASTRPVSVST